MWDESIYPFLNVAVEVLEWISFCMKETWEHASVHRQQGIYRLSANYFMRWMPVANRGPRNIRDKPCAQRANNSVMTHLSNRIGISWTLLLTGYNSESILNKNNSPLGCSHLALTLEVWEWISNSIPQYMMGVITHPCRDSSMSIKGDPRALLPHLRLKQYIHRFLWCVITR